jgi:EmrB/QacA subfamily drug resistance transporter
VSERQPRQHYNVTLAVLGISALAYAVAQTMVVPALPEIQHDLGVSPTQVTWVLTVYLLGASVATPIVGRLGDMYGKERMLLVALSLFGVGLLVSALSHSLGLLVAGRAIQGLGGAVFPLAFGIIRDEFPREKVATGIGLISAIFGIGGGAGLILSGLIVDRLPYEWIFWLALLVVVAAAIMTWLYVPESPIRAPARIDWLGAMLMTLGLVLLLLGVSEGNEWGWSSERIVALLGAGVAVLALWTWFESRADHPLVDMRMMRRRGVWTTNVTALLVGFGMFGAFILTPRLVETPTATGYGFGASVSEAGLFMLPSTLVMLIAGPVAGWLGSRVGSRVPVLIGTACAGAGFVWLALAHSEPWQILVGLGVLGLGIGFSFAAMANVIVEAVEPTETGVATGMNTIMRMTGGSLGG